MNNYEKTNGDVTGLCVSFHFFLHFEREISSQKTIIFTNFILTTFVYITQAGTRTIEIELTTLSSTHHVELNPSDAGFQDRYIVQEIIKEMARNRPIDTKGKRGFKGKKFSYCSDAT